MRYIAFLAALVAALTLAPPAAAASDWAWPVRGDVVTPYKNGDDPYAAGQHRGIDIAAPVGTRVSAATGGRVTFAGVAGSSGLTVNVRTADGSYDVSYLHLSAVATRQGDTVGRGDPIGAVGTSGTRSLEQSHLHLGVREAGDRHAYRDPLDFLPPLAPPAVEEPPPAPVKATDPLPAPPAEAPALTGAPAEVTTDALAPLPSGLSLGALVTHGDAPSPAGAPGSPAAHAPAAPSAHGSGAPSGRGAHAGHGSSTAAAHAVAPRGHGALTPAEPGAPSTRAASHPEGAPSPHHGSHRAKPPPGGRAIKRADLASPEAAPHKARPATTAPELHLAPRDRAGPANHPAEPGVDLGRLTAVLGLVALATCLGRPQQTRRAVRTSRTALGAMLRPLAGRG